VIRIEAIFKDKEIKLFQLINNINTYNLNHKFPSMKRTIKNFDPDDIYDEISYYSYELRNWLDRMPQVPNDVEVGFIKYLYKFVYSEQGGE